MDRATYDDYLHRFNTQDPSVFERYIDPDLKLRNGPLALRGREAMRGMYVPMWSTFTEHVTYDRFTQQEDRFAVQLTARFTVLRDDPSTVLGPVRKGELMEFQGLALYQAAQGRFTEIVVAYNHFFFTGLDGVKVDRGIPF